MSNSRFMSIRQKTEASSEDAGEGGSAGWSSPALVKTRSEHIQSFQTCDIKKFRSWPIFCILSCWMHSKYKSKEFSRLLLLWSKIKGAVHFSPLKDKFTTDASARRKVKQVFYVWTHKPHTHNTHKTQNSFTTEGRSKGSGFSVSTYLLNHILWLLC